MTFGIYAEMTVVTLMFTLFLIRSAKATNGVAFLCFLWSLIPVVQLGIIAVSVLYYLATQSNNPLDWVANWWKSNPYK